MFNPFRLSPKPRIKFQISEGLEPARSNLQLRPHSLAKSPNINVIAIYRPEFVIALVRTPFLSSRYAQFRVPLNFNKLDLRDYLQNLYGVGVVSVRSYIEQQPITRITRDGRNIGQWRRPLAQKRMTVELREPFAYPEQPKDLSPYVFPHYLFYTVALCMVGMITDSHMRLVVSSTLLTHRFQYKQMGEELLGCQRKVAKQDAEEVAGWTSQGRGT